MAHFVGMHVHPENLVHSIRISKSANQLVYESFFFFLQSDTQKGLLGKSCFSEVLDAHAYPRNV